MFTFQPFKSWPRVEESITCQSAGAAHTAQHRPADKIELRQASKTSYLKVFLLLAGQLRSLKHIIITVTLIFVITLNSVSG